MCEERMLLGLELAARPPGWNAVSSPAGRSNIPAGMVLSLPKLRFDKAPLPKGVLLGVELEAGAGDGLGLCVWLGVEAGEEPKPENDAAAGLEVAGREDPKPPKLRGAEGAAGLVTGAAEAAGAAVAVAAGAGAGEDPKPAKDGVDGLADDAAGVPNPLKANGAAAGFAAGAAGADVDEVEGAGAGADRKPVKTGVEGLEAAAAGAPKPLKLSGADGAADFGAAAGGADKDGAAEDPNPAKGAAAGLVAAAAAAAAGEPNPPKVRGVEGSADFGAAAAEAVVTGAMELGAGDDSKPANGVAAGLAVAGSGEPKPPKLSGADGAAAFGVEAVGAVVGATLAPKPGDTGKPKLEGAALGGVAGGGLDSTGTGGLGVTEAN